MTKAPTLAPVPYSRNNLVPLTGKPPVQSIHTEAKTLMKAPKATTVIKKKAGKRKPVDLLRSMLSSSDDSSGGNCDSSSLCPTKTATLSPPSKELLALKTLTFQKPSGDDIAAFDLETVQAIRSNDLDQLRQLYCNGKSMNACNQFGESLLHMACRRGYSKIVDFLLREVKVRTDRCDDFGRNPFHDALWTPNPNFDVVDLLIEFADPTLLLSEDVRGNTPFAYARRDHNERWIEFLEKRRDKLANRIGGCASTAASPVEFRVVG